MNHLKNLYRNHREIWSMGGFSAFFHLLVFALLLNFHLPPAFNTEPAVCYVDLPDLPVAQPQAGTGSSPAAMPEPAPTPPSPEMAMPTKPVDKMPVRSLPQPAQTPADNVADPKEFEERLARIEREAESRHAAAALEALRKKAAAGAALGVPGASGTQAGSDYLSYVQSRLKDAFKTTIAFQSKNPEVAMRIAINRYGRFAQIKMERSTGDKVFEEAVARAIAKAESMIPAPPRGEDIETGFVFRPQGVGTK